jgi:hypothetical protein
LPVIQKYCFVAGTLVHTANGLVPIEKITVGTEVLTRNQSTGKLEYKKVTATFKHNANEILKISFQGHKDPISVTPDHPFYARKQQCVAPYEGRSEPEWKPAKELHPGDQVRSRSGEWIDVLSVQRQRENTPVYNFEVSLNHNYFVGDTGLLVHNECVTFPNLRPWKLAEELAIAAKFKVKPMRIGEAGFDKVIFKEGEGTIKWAVTTEGELLVIPHTVRGQEISHAVITEGRAVVAAGEAQMVEHGGEYMVFSLTNRSGHFEPSAESLDIGKLAFGNNGVQLLGDTGTLKEIIK